VVDHQLDLVIAPDRTVEWKDEDELTAAVEAGWLTEEDAESAYAAAHRLAKLATGASPPFDDRWTRFRPDPAWPVPPLPPDWRH
jgi:predicted RNA-binding protein associated with RNAse of E/G family